MAIYHLSAKIVSRSKGHSAVAAAAYRHAERIKLEREDVVWDYSKKLGVEHSEIMLPEGAPEWMKDRAQLWNAVENGEKRKDAQLARELQIALPVELPGEDQLALVRNYAQKEFVDQGMVADVAIHRDNPENPHAHIMLTMRHLEGDGFGKKCVEWNQRAKLIGWRESWAKVANHQLELAGHQVRIDHRSFKAQGIELEPGIHHGATAGRARGGAEYARAAARLARLEQIQRRNADAIVADPAIALRAITHQRAVFTERDLAKWASTHTADRADFERVRSAVMNSPELIELEPGRYTSHEMAQAELGLLRDAQRLDDRFAHRLSGRLVKQALRSQPKLSNEQREMVRYVLEGGDLAIVEGAAGTGKSWGLRSARHGWEAAGYRVHGAALAGRAAQELQESAGITARSVASWEASWKHGVRKLGHKDVLVIDEAGMLGSRQLGRVIAEAQKRGAKVVLVGDTHQLQAIEAGAALRLLANEHGKAELRKVYRQRHRWQVDANYEIRDGDAAKGLSEYQQRGALQGHGSKSEAMKAVLNRWHEVARDGREVVMLAHERVDVAAFNEVARSRLRADGKLGPDHAIKTEEGQRNFATGDRICFRGRNDELGVVNGTLGTVEEIKGNQMVVRLDGEEPRQVVFDTRDYNQLEHGFASTVHRTQGRSIDEVVVYAGGYWNRELAYVAMSRQREQAQLHWDKETFRDQEHLFAQLGRSEQKVNVQDFADQEREVGRVAHEVEKRAAEELRHEIQERQPVRDQEDVIHKGPHVREMVDELRERERVHREQSQPAAERDISPEVMAKIEARMAAREKELDARVELEERMARRGKELEQAVEVRLSKEREQEQKQERAPRLSDKGRGFER